jgi:hypothetical protein
MGAGAPARVIGAAALGVAILATILAIVVILGPWPDGGRGAGPEGMHIADGAVQLTRPGAPARPAIAGERVRTHDVVRIGPGERAVLRAGQGTELTLDGATELRVLDVRADTVDLELDGGRVRAEVRPGTPSVTVRRGGRAVSTADGAIVVAVDGDTFAAQVERGRASLIGFDDAVELRAGERALAIGSQAAMLAPIPERVVLDVAWPDARRTRADAVQIAGTTSPGARVVLRGADGRPVAIHAGPDGRFAGVVPLREGEQPIVVEAIDPFGERVQATILIERDTTPPRIRGGAGAPP